MKITKNIPSEHTQKKKILVADDEELILEIMDNFLCEDYEVLKANNGSDAIVIAYEEDIDLIILDVNMPGLNGYEVCRILKNADNTKNIPIIFLTGLKDRESKLEGLKAGGNDFLTKPVDTFELKLRVRNMLYLNDYWKMLENYNLVLEQEVDKKTTELKTAYKDLALANRKIKDGYIDTIYRLSLAAEFKDPDTASHLLRISKLSSYLAKKLNFSENDVERIYFASPMHDIGKIAIPESILMKPNSLNRKEIYKMQQHPIIGEKLLHGSESDIINSAEKIASTHHEKFNGKGYPKGLQKDEIPVEGQVVMIVDVYDALRTPRPYKKPYSHQESINIINKGDNRVSSDDFNPEYKTAFLDNHHEIKNVYENSIKEMISFQNILNSRDFDSFRLKEIENDDYRR